MSRIGKKPILVPEDVRIEKTDNLLTVTGPKGRLQRSFSSELKIIFDEKENRLRIERPTDSKRHKSLHGLTRTLLNNMVEGVSKGYEKSLIIKGVGYSAKIEGKDLVLRIGLTHPVKVKIPDGLVVDLPKQTADERTNYTSRIIIKGIDKELLGQFAACVRSIKPPDPYKQKGIRYKDEIVRQKAGKAFVGAE